MRTAASATVSVICSRVRLPFGRYQRQTLMTNARTSRACIRGSRSANAPASIPSRDQPAPVVLDLGNQFPRAQPFGLLLVGLTRGGKQIHVVLQDSALQGIGGRGIQPDRDGGAEGLLGVGPTIGCGA